MLIEVKVPQLSESVSEATLLSWHKKEGEAVKRDENLVDIEISPLLASLNCCGSLPNTAFLFMVLLS